MIYQLNNKSGIVIQYQTNDVIATIIPKLRDFLNTKSYIICLYFYNLAAFISLIATHLCINLLIFPQFISFFFINSNFSLY